MYGNPITQVVACRLSSKFVYESTTKSLFPCICTQKFVLVQQCALVQHFCQLHCAHYVNTP